MNRNFGFLSSPVRRPAARQLTKTTSNRVYTEMRGIKEKYLTCIYIIYIQIAIKIHKKIAHSTAVYLLGGSRIFSLVPHFHSLSLSISISLSPFLLSLFLPYHTPPILTEGTEKALTTITADDHKSYYVCVCMCVQPLALLFFAYFPGEKKINTEKK